MKVILFGVLPKVLPRKQVHQKSTEKSELKHLRRDITYL